MSTIKVVEMTSLMPQQVLGAAHDFTARRAEVFPAVSVELASAAAAAPLFKSCGWVRVLRELRRRSEIVECGLAKGKDPTLRCEAASPRSARAER